MSIKFVIGTKHFYNNMIIISLFQHAQMYDSIIVSVALLCVRSFIDPRAQLCLRECSICFLRLELAEGKERRRER